MRPTSSRRRGRGSRQLCLNQNGAGRCRHSTCGQEWERERSLKLGARNAPRDARDQRARAPCHSGRPGRRKRLCAGLELGDEAVQQQTNMAVLVDGMAWISRTPLALQATARKVIRGPADYIWNPCTTVHRNRDLGEPVSQRGLDCRGGGVRWCWLGYEHWLIILSRPPSYSWRSPVSWRRIALQPPNHHLQSSRAGGNSNLPSSSLSHSFHVEERRSECVWRAPTPEKCIPALWLDAGRRRSLLGRSRHSHGGAYIILRTW
jgi:hypothetical protein